MPRCWLRDLRLADAAYRRYVARLAAEMTHTLLWRRASNVAKRVWRERVLPFLLEDAAPPPGWGAA